MLSLFWVSYGLGFVVMCGLEGLIFLCLGFGFCCVLW